MNDVPIPGGPARKEMWGQKKDGQSTGLIPGRETIGPLLLMLSTPVAALLLVHLNVTHDGSLAAIGKQLAADPLTVLGLGFTDKERMLDAAKILGYFAGFQLLLMRLIPGKTHEGPTTEMGHVPVYNANGPQAFFLTVFTFLYGAYVKQWWNASIIYDYYPEMVSFMCIFSLVFCLFLYFKGIVAPSSPDHSTSGNPVADYYWCVSQLHLAGSYA